MKSIAPFAAGSAFLLTAIVSASILISPSKPWQVWLLNTAHRAIAETAIPRWIPYADALAVALALGLLAAVAALLIFAKLEILAAGWASKKSLSALHGKGELTVEEEMRALVKRYGRR